jgi:hypothetical protein
MSGCHQLPGLMALGSAGTGQAGRVRMGRGGVIVKGRTRAGSRVGPVVTSPD